MGVHKLRIEGEGNQECHKCNGRKEDYEVGLQGNDR